MNPITIFHNLSMLGMAMFLTGISYILVLRQVFYDSWYVITGLDYFAVFLFIFGGFAGAVSYLVKEGFEVEARKRRRSSE